MTPSETKLKQLAERVGELRDSIDPDACDLELIGDLIDTLMRAEDALAAAGLFAQAVADPHSLRFAWATGQKPFDPEAALRQLGKTAEYITSAVEKQLYGEEEEEGTDALAIPPDLGPYYRVRTGGAEVRVESPRPIPIDEVCAAALRKLAKSGVCLSPVMEVLRCADFAVPETTVFVSTREQLEKAGLLAAEGREA
jgi:hypothetical protein